MERNQFKTDNDKETASDLNAKLAYDVIKNLAQIGVNEWCISPGIRNAALIDCLASSSLMEQHFFFDDRAAAFFALGRSRITKRPVAVIVTSGTAVGELLPSAMEAFYTHTPLVFVTADRPKRYRHTGAPQTANQENIFGVYCPHFEDLEAGHKIAIADWALEKPAHINVCLEEAYHHNYENFPEIDLYLANESKKAPVVKGEKELLTHFFEKAKYPLIVVGTLSEEEREPVKKALLKWGLPVVLEGNSRLLHDLDLKQLRVTPYDDILKLSNETDYPIDAVLRIGGVPTLRLWRDLEKLESRISVLSLSRFPFSGLPHGGLIQASLEYFLDEQLPSPKPQDPSNFFRLLKLKDEKILKCFKLFPKSEPALMHSLSRLIPKEASVYLGNSLPIREWDLFSSENAPFENISSSRGVNGIDGQISTFLGLSQNKGSHFAIIGDLTALYDLSAPWIAREESFQRTLFIINNGGGKIFARKKLSDAFVNPHSICFKPLADLYQLNYEKWEGEIPSTYNQKSGLTIIEVIPDDDETNFFWEEIKRD